MTLVGTFETDVGRDVAGLEVDDVGSVVGVVEEVGLSKPLFLSNDDDRP